MGEFIRDPVVDSILGSAIKVHRVLGPGLLESAYKACLSFEFVNKGLKFQREVAVPIQYEETRIDCGYRLDFLVDGAVVIEVKAIEKVLPIHEAQAMTYLRLARPRFLLLLNFNCLTLKAGLKCYVGTGTAVPVDLGLG